MQGTYVWQSAVTVAANRVATNPLKVSPLLGDIWLDKVHIRIPPGPKGNTGVSIVNAGVGIVPFGGNPTFMLADDELLEYDVGAEVNNGLQVWTYNTDVTAHTIQVRWIGRPMSVENLSSTPQPISALALSA
jgi:hypothetical protein